jgi:hypothetical protein
MLGGWGWRMNGERARGGALAVEEVLGEVGMGKVVSG